MLKIILQIFDGIVHSMCHSYWMGESLHTDGAAV